MFRPLVLLSVFVNASLGALMPRQSATSSICAVCPSIGAYQFPLSGSQYLYAYNELQCTYGSGAGSTYECPYTPDGMPLYSGGFNPCPTSVPVVPFSCPSISGASAGTVEISSNGELTCAYAEGTCVYDTTQDGGYVTGTAGETFCPKEADPCSRSLSRRRYKTVDNFAAVQRKRAGEAARALVARDN